MNFQNYMQLELKPELNEHYTILKCCKIRWGI